MANTKEKQKILLHKPAEILLLKFYFVFFSMFAKYEKEIEKFKWLFVIIRKLKLL